MERTNFEKLQVYQLAESWRIAVDDAVNMTKKTKFQVQSTKLK